MKERKFITIFHFISLCSIRFVILIQQLWLAISKWYLHPISLL